MSTIQAFLLENQQLIWEKMNWEIISYLKVLHIVIKRFGLLKDARILKCHFCQLF